MRKKSRYKPRPIIPDAMAYVRSGLLKITQVPEAGTKLQLLNYSSLDEIIRGNPTKTHVDDLINVMNISEILADKYKIGDDYLDLIYKGQDAVYNMAQRGLSGKSFRFTGEELEVVKEVFELHTEQLKHTSVKQMEKALNDVRDVYLHRRARVIKPKEEA